MRFKIIYLNEYLEYMENWRNTYNFDKEEKEFLDNEILLLQKKTKITKSDIYKYLRLGWDEARLTRALMYLFNFNSIMVHSLINADFKERNINAVV